MSRKKRKTKIKNTTSLLNRIDKNNLTLNKIYQAGRQAISDGKLSKAKDLFLELKEVNNKSKPVLFNLSLIKWHEGKQKEALDEMYELAFSEPPHITALFELSAGYLKIGKIDKSLEVLKKWSKENGENHLVLHNIATSYSSLGEFNKAIEYYEKCLKAASKLKSNNEDNYDVADTYTSYASSLRYASRPFDAIKALKTALKINPQKKSAFWNLAITEMEELGKMGKALKDLEEGFKLGKRAPNRKFEVPRWDGTPTNKKLLVWREQGIGDEIKFAAQIPETLNIAPNTIIECEPRLVKLFKNSFPKATIKKQESGYRRKDPFRNDIDFHSAMGSLRYLSYKKRNNLISPVRYIEPDPKLVAKWKDKLDKLGDNIKVGLCWRSHNLSPVRKHQYPKIDDLKPIFDVKGVDFINLTYAKDRQDEIKSAKDNFGVTIYDWPDEIDHFNDMDNVFALTDACDLILTSHTINCEIGGALGKETWRFEALSPTKNYPLSHHNYDLPAVKRIMKHYEENWLEIFIRIKKYLENYVCENHSQ